MNRQRKRLWATLVVLAVLALRDSASAMGPSVIMIYGGGLRAPVFLVARSADDQQNRLRTFWCGAPAAVSPKQVGDGPYLNVAIFYGVDVWTDPAAIPATLQTLTPERANQQGRLYLPVPQMPGAVVTTSYPRATRVDTADGPKYVDTVVPVPTTADQFQFLCWLDSTDVETARSLGIPGL